MRLSGSLALLAAITTSCLAASKPPKANVVNPPGFFQIQVKSQPASGRSPLFDNYFLFSQAGSDGAFAITLTKSNGNADFWGFTNPSNESKTTTYSLDSFPQFSPETRAQISTLGSSNSLWLPIALSGPNSKPGKSNPLTYTTGFYLNGTASRGQTLEWSDYPDNVVRDSFQGWLGECSKSAAPDKATDLETACEWSLGVPQLFWLTKDYNGGALPTSCEEVVLDILSISGSS